METAVKTRFKGLCTTCRFAADCTFPHFHAKTVEECLEFEIAQPSKKRQHMRNGRLEDAGSAESQPRERMPAKALQGLCRTCDRVKTCTFDKPDSGVWYCEEYL